MIDPTLAASAVSTGLDLLRNLSAPEETKANDVVNRDDFLTLLITQLQNQDPLDPVSSEDFSAQLAQFSSLEQLTEINDKLSALEQPSGAAPSQFEMLSLLGREVDGLGISISVAEGASSSLHFELATAGTVEARVIDGSGQEVATLDLGTLEAGMHEFDLENVVGAPALSDGEYTVLIDQGNGDQTLPLQTLVRGRVTGIDFATDPPALLLGETRLALDDVSKIREVQGS